MNASIKNQLKTIMNLAWQFVKQNGFTMSDALKCAWANIKLKACLASGIVCFTFRKVDGSLRQAFGTLANTPATANSGRKPNDKVQTYYDTEKQEWRCFKKCNLISVGF